MSVSRTAAAARGYTHHNGRPSRPPRTPLLVPGVGDTVTVEAATRHTNLATGIVLAVVSDPPLIVVRVRTGRTTADLSYHAAQLRVDRKAVR